MPPSLLLDLPTEFIGDGVTPFLQAPDILHLLSTCRTLHALGQPPRFWNSLKQVHFMDDGKEIEDAREAKVSYLIQAQMNYLPVVKWKHVDTIPSNIPSAREGHLACRLGDYMILTGGFTDDSYIYYKHVDADGVSWTPVLPTGTLPTWVYGATLTALDDTRAIRFGGFQNGGYSGETSEVALLNFVVNQDTQEAEVSWQVVSCSKTKPFDVEDDIGEWELFAARAYHSSLLLFHRYLFVVGGMQYGGVNPLLLDTQTWTWYFDELTTQCPMLSRNGASIISDMQKRDRLLLFGGGDGSDLLRSGTDYSEVWELQMNNCKADSIHESLPWKWNLVSSGADLAPEAKLNLGRCHAAAKVSGENILFAFGSGRPSCNTLLGYRLNSNSFFELNIKGSFPRDRFTCASLFLEDKGYWLFHSGFSSGPFGTGTVNDLCVLDVAGGLDRPFLLHRLQPYPRCYRSPVTDNTISRSSVIRGLIVGLRDRERRRFGRHALADDGTNALYARLVAMGLRRDEADVQMEED